MVEPGWGEHKARERQAERRVANQWTLVACLVAAGGVRFAIGFLDDIIAQRREPAVSPFEAGLTALALLVVGIVMGARTWRLLDEVQRRETLGWLAATGAGAIVARPLLLVTQPMLHLADPTAAGWYAAIGIGLATALIQWWRRS